MIGNRNTGLLIQVACLIEVTTKTGFTGTLKILHEKKKNISCKVFLFYCFKVPDSNPVGGESFSGIKDVSLQRDLSKSPSYHTLVSVYVGLPVAT